MKPGALLLVVGIAASSLLLADFPALAQEPVGCDKFKWPLYRERTMLASGDVRIVDSGGSVDSMPAVAMDVHLVPLAEANLPTAPERTPKAERSFAGFIKFTAPPRDGIYKITLSSDAWIDVLQNDHFVKSAEHSSASGCADIRKSVKFDLAAIPFVVQLSNVQTNTIAMTVTGE